MKSQGQFLVEEVHLQTVIASKVQCNIESTPIMSNSKCRRGVYTYIHEAYDEISRDTPEGVGCVK